MQSHKQWPFQDRKPPAQPQKKDTSFPKNDTTIDVLQHDFLPVTNISAATWKPVPLSSLNRNHLMTSRGASSSSISISSAPNQGIQRKPHTLPSQKRFEPSTSCVDIHPNSNDTIATKDDFFPGAIGTVPVPMSIKQSSNHIKSLASLSYGMHSRVLVQNFEGNSPMPTIILQMMITMTLQLHWMRNKVPYSQRWDGISRQNTHDHHLHRIFTQTKSIWKIYSHMSVFSCL